MKFCWHNWGDGWTDIPKNWDSYPPKEQYKRCVKCKRLRVKSTRLFDDR